MPTVMPDVFQTTTASSISLALVAWVCFTCALYLHRWLGKLAGHPIGQSPSVKTIP